MNVNALLDSLEHFPPALRAAVAGLSAEDITWRPPDDAWSILEVVTHLADEEKLDFKVRLRMTLEDPTQQWPTIDPQSWVTQRNYNAGNLNDTLDRFTAERARSMQWLRSLDDPDWNAAKPHPKVGPITAGELLGSWAAHDWFHLRQIAKRRVQLVERANDPHRIGYAGGTL